MTQAELGEAVGVSNRVIADYEGHEAQPPGAMLVDLAKTLKVTSDELLGIKPFKEKASPKKARLLKRLVKFDEITSRITGLSCPIFGVSWTPPEPDRKVGGSVIAYLEDRRVLYAPSEIEIPHHCVDSVLQIREYLTHELQVLDRDTPLAATLRALRAACRKFLDTIGPMDHRFGPIDHGYNGWVFIAALGELRGSFGIYLITLATSYGLDMEDDLASILPTAPEDETPHD